MKCISYNKKMGEIINNTLAELIISSIAELKRKRKESVRRKKHINAQKSGGNSNSVNPVSIGISNIIANSKPIKNKKNKEAKKELKLEEAAEEAEDGKEKESLGGYGTIKHYNGMLPYVQYANYGKIWSHIGAFASKSAYENPLERASLRSSMSESTGILVSMEVIEKAQKHFKYFVRGDIMGDIGYVPPFGSGIDSKDWEKYRLMTQMSVYMPLLKLMRSII